MRIANNEDIEATPNLMPLIDVVFLLLIFFLVAGSFAEEEREQNLPLPRTSKAAQPMSAVPRQLIVNILHDGSMKVSGETIKPKELRGMLVVVARDEPDRKVLIRAHEGSLFKYFAGVLDLSTACGIDSVKVGYLAYEPKATPVSD